MANRQEGVMTPQWQGAPEVIRDTRQLARQSYTKLSDVIDPKDQVTYLRSSSSPVQNRQAQ
jgi:hypothetical protein